jgi:cbb3-type cytochrome oxidase subunit 1
LLLPVRYWSNNRQSITTSHYQWWWGHSALTLSLCSVSISSNRFSSYPSFSW